MAPIATLTVRLSAQIAEFQSEFKDATKQAQKFADDFEGVATKAAAVGSFFGTIAADIAKSLASGFVGAIRDAVKFSSEFSNAFLGLSSVARHFGEDTGLATAAAKQLSADGLLPLRDSATGLKNLLAAGFNLDQSIKLMNAFKDSAAFGRQGALSFGEAIRGATEGVKNGNSILVDNSGITKNLSQILKEAGFSAQDLSRATTDSGVRMALFNGILKEAAAFTGDAAKLTQTYTGAVTRLETGYHTLLASLGDAITQNKTVAIGLGFVGDAVQHLTLFLSDNKRGFDLVSDAVIFFAKSLSASLGFIDLVQTGFAGLQIAFNETARAGLKMAQDILATASVAAHLRAALDPIFGDEWKQKALLADAALAGVTAHMQGFQDASKDATARSIAWGNTLQTGSARLDGLVKTLEAARGKTVEFGDTGVVAFDKSDKSITKLTASQKKWAALQAEILQSAIPLTLQQQLQVRALDALGISHSKIADFIGATDAQMKRFEDSLKATAASIAHIGKQILALPHNVPLRLISTDLSGPAGLIDVDAVIRASNAVQQVNDATFGHIEGRMASHGVFTQRELQRQAAFFAQEYDRMQASGLFTYDELAQAAKRSADAQRAALSGIGARLIDSLKGAITGGFGNLAADLSAAITGGGTLLQAFQNYGTNVAKNFAQSALAMIPGIGPILSEFAGPIIDGLKKAFGSIFGIGTAGRAPVVDFAKTFGGFDALHAKLAELGAEGEQLWIKLTQGVGRNNSKEAQAAIEAVTAALDRHKAAQDKVSESATAAGIAQSEATKKAQAAIDELTGKIQSLQQSIANEAPEEVIGVIEANTRAQIAAIEDQRTAAQTALDDTTKSAAIAAKEAGDIIDTALASREFHIRVKVDLDGLPGGGAVPGFQHGTRGHYLNFGAGQLAVLHGRERIITEHEPVGTEGGTVQVFIGNEQLDSRTVRVARKDAARGGLRTRAGQGRSW